MRVEIWRSIYSHQGVYEVSDRGHVRSLSRRLVVQRASRSYMRQLNGRILKPSLCEYGHLTVTLWFGHEKRQERVHVLVLEAFVSLRPGELYGCHRDGDPSNNAVSNLYWGTPKQNTADMVAHGTKLLGSKTGSAKLCESDIINLRADGSRFKQSILKEKYGLSQAQVSRILSRKHWSHIPETIAAQV